MVPFELDLLHVVHTVYLWADNQAHTSLVYSKLPVMRHVNDGFGLRFLHLNASDLGSAPDLVTALLCVTLVKCMSSYGL